MSTPLSTVALPRLVRLSDAARELSISERHLRDSIKRQKITVVRIGRSVRLARETVEQLARDGIPA